MFNCEFMGTGRLPGCLSKEDNEDLAGLHSWLYRPYNTKVAVQSVVRAHVRSNQ